MQRFIGLAPRRERQFRPRGEREIAHRISPHMSRRQGSPDDKAGHDRPGLILWEAQAIGDAVSSAFCYFALPGFLSNAASTSSFLMRAEGFPGSLRFCSSVPSPIIPGWSTFFVLECFGSDLLVMRYLRTQRRFNQPLRSRLVP